MMPRNAGDGEEELTDEVKLEMELQMEHEHEHESEREREREDGHDMNSGAGEHESREYAVQGQIGDHNGSVAGPMSRSTSISASPTTPTWHDWALCIGAEIMGEVRKAVWERLHYTCSAGIAHNKAMAKVSLRWRSDD